MPDRGEKPKEGDVQTEVHDRSQSAGDKEPESLRFEVKGRRHNGLSHPGSLARACGSVVLQSALNDLGIATGPSDLIAGEDH
ncbi:hypothetical protein GCM10009632_18750 [Mycolicibacterium alvei]|uniref:Uncharacterized protein n=1 Tax=Mycolicibacterium alvei TaxID=67081 RepID=A0A6N4UWG8_9MYCO|nr:hypothetical protein MALV_38840 [Mycolicibacterium alvei]